MEQVFYEVSNFRVLTTTEEVCVETCVEELSVLHEHVEQQHLELVFPPHMARQGLVSGEREAAEVQRTDRHRGVLQLLQPQDCLDEDWYELGGQGVVSVVVLGEHGHVLRGL